MWDVPSGDFHEIAIGVEQVDGVRDFMVAEFEGDAAGLEFGLGAWEIRVGRGAKSHVPGAAIGAGGSFSFSGNKVMNVEPRRSTMGLPDHWPGYTCSKPSVSMYHFLVVSGEEQRRAM